ncbi:hypothetical protein MSPP1_001940 [Malassezia sp. CBS 17886]|nr:hypothetical protein MSPP1_001940 [Malassezia sp. CBS 17886]
MFGASTDPSVVPDWMNTPQPAGAPGVGPDAARGSSRLLDLVFIIDATGSMGIASATRNIEAISDSIVQSELLAEAGALRVGLIAYRDHPPQDHVYIVKNCACVRAGAAHAAVGFTTSIHEMKENLNSLFAAGGGDGPEAMTAALKAATDLDWRRDAAKMAILVTDAPPHGIGEYGDGFPNGSPDGEDPLVLARRLSSMGISLFVVACEPALSGYQHAVDFYQGLVIVTAGLLVPLTTASLLSHVVIAAAGEVMDMERLHHEVGDAVLERLQSLSLDMGGGAEGAEGAASAHLMDQVAAELHEKLLLRNESTKQLVMESIYRDSDESAHNIRVWSQAPDVFTARPHIRKVVGSRLSQKFLDMRRAAMSGSSPYVAEPAVALAPADPHTHTRRIATDFAAFQGRAGLSVGGAEGAARLPASTGPYRTAAGDMMDDDADDAFMADDAPDSPTVPPAAAPRAAGVHVSGEDGQVLSYRQDSITLAQARRLAVQSVSRAQ